MSSYFAHKGKRARMDGICVRLPLQKWPRRSRSQTGALFARRMPPQGRSPRCKFHRPHLLFQGSDFARSYGKVLQSVLPHAIFYVRIIRIYRVGGKNL